MVQVIRSIVIAQILFWISGFGFVHAYSQDRLAEIIEKLEEPKSLSAQEIEDYCVEGVTIARNLSLSDDEEKLLDRLFENSFRTQNFELVCSELELSLDGTSSQEQLLFFLFLKDRLMRSRVLLSESFVAIQHSEDCIKLTKDMEVTDELRELLISFHSNRASIFSSFLSYDLAIDAAWKTLALCNDAKYDRQKADSYRTLAMAAEAKGEYEKSIEYLNIIEGLANEGGAVIMEILIQHKASVYLEMGETEPFIDLQKELRYLSLTNKNSRHKHMENYAFGLVKFGLAEYDSSLLFLEPCKEYFGAWGGLNSMNLNLHEKMSLCYYRLGNLDSGDVYHSVAQDIKEKLDAQRLDGAVASYLLLNQNREKAENEVLREHRSNMIWTIVFLTICLAMLAVLFVAFYKWRKKREVLKGKLLRYENELLKSREQEKKMQVEILQEEKNKSDHKALEAMEKVESVVEELEQKKKELTTYTLQLLEKQGFIDELQTVIKQKARSGATKDDRSLFELQKVIRSHAISQNNWEEFKLRFEGVHSTFYSALTAKFGDFTNSELRLAALIKLDLSSKEIAALLNQSERGVITARSRLRKKLQLGRESNLHVFFNQLTQDEVKAGY